MNNNAYRKLALTSISDVPRRDLESTLTILVQQGAVSAEQVNETLSNVQAAYHERLKAISALEKQLSPEQQEALLSAVKARFEANKERHPGIKWSEIQAKLEANPKKMWSLNEMERSGGEPDVVDYEIKTHEYLIFDCSAESPEGRRNIVYDREAQDWLEKNSPEIQCNGNAVDMAAAMGVEIPDSTQYKEMLQKLGQFDRKTSSWLKTPADGRKLGFAFLGYRIAEHIGLLKCHVHAHRRNTSFRGLLRV